MDAVPEVDVSEAELRALRKKAEVASRLQAQDLEPAPCISKAGFSTTRLFSGSRGSKGARGAPRTLKRTRGDILLPVSQKGGAGPKDLSIKDYARIFDKLYAGTGGSPIDRLVASCRVVQDPALDASIDAEIAQRALRETRAKYLSASLARKHGVVVPGVTGAPPRPPYMLGLAMVPAGASGGHLPPEQQQLQQDVHSSAQVVELAQTLAEADKMRSLQHDAREKRDQDMISMYVTRAAVPVPASSSFMAPTRQQAEHAANRNGTPNLNTPGPGKYSPQWQYWERPVPTTLLAKPQYGQEIKRTRGGTNTSKQPSSAVSSSGRSGSQGPPQGKAGASPLEGRAANAATVFMGSPAGGGAQGLRHNLGAEPSSPRWGTGRQGLGGLAQEGGARGREASGPLSGRGLFTGAHHVHGAGRHCQTGDPNVDPTDGTSSFKAIARPPLANRTGGEGSHLALKYFQEGIDDQQRRSPHLVLSFGQQTVRPKFFPDACTPSSLGPGSYSGSVTELPTSLTGAHVLAGHRGIRHTPDFAKTAPRPDTAPPAATAPLSMQAASEDGAQAAFQGAQEEGSLEPPPLGFQQLEASMHPLNYTTRTPRSERQAQHEGGEGGQQEGRPRTVALGLDQIEKYNSAGLARPTPGGSFSRTTRAQGVQSMRVCSEGRIVPPASAPLHKIRPSQAADVSYDATDPLVQGHHPRPASWRLPPNRAAHTRKWIAPAALAYA